MRTQDKNTPKPEEVEEESGHGAAYAAATIFVILGVVLICAPFFIPDVFRPLVVQSSVDSVAALQLHDPINTGLFKWTARSGDTKPSDDATFMAVSILSSYPDQARLQHSDQLVKYASKLQAAEFNRNTKSIYQGIVLLKLTQQYAPAVAEKFHKLLLSLVEPRSGFRFDLGRSASVGATYYAFFALRELGKLEDFKTKDEYRAAVQFLTSMKDRLGGFKDSNGRNATILATYQAVQALSSVDPQALTPLLEELDGFLADCQQADGGFANSPSESSSNLISTAQALFLNEIAQPHRKDSVVDVWAASSYLRSCVSIVSGVHRSDSDDDSDLESTYNFFLLLRSLPNLEFATPRNLQVGLVTIGITFLVFGLFSGLKVLLPGLTDPLLNRSISFSAILLVCGCVFAQVFSPAAVVAYLILATYLCVEAFEILERDFTFTQPVTAIMAAVFGGAHLLLFLALSYIVPEAFPQLMGSYALLFWNIPSSFLASYMGCYVYERQQLRRLINAAFLGWAGSQLLEFVLLYARGDLQEITRLAFIRGHLASVFVLVPLASLMLSYVFTALGCSLYPASKRHQN